MSEKLNRTMNGIMDGLTDFQVLPAFLHECEDVIPECIPVLFQESSRCVVHVTSIVPDAKPSICNPWLDVEQVFL